MMMTESAQICGQSLTLIKWYHIPQPNCDPPGTPHRGSDGGTAAATRRILPFWAQPSKQGFLQKRTYISSVALQKRATYKSQLRAVSKNKPRMTTFQPELVFC